MNIYLRVFGDTINFPVKKFKWKILRMVVVVVVEVVMGLGMLVAVVQHQTYIEYHQIACHEYNIFLFHFYFLFFLEHVEDVL